jgi:hypothetical protein
MRLVILALAAATLWGQEAKNQIRDRGQTVPSDESQAWTRGRLGTQAPLPQKSATHNGTLIDASCDDRSVMNLGRAPEQNDIAPPPSPGAPKGGNPTPPPEVAANMNAQVVSRQPDRTCSITGGTRGFAILTTNGRLLNLDEGGNTLANQALYSNAAGRAMINGTGSGIKPQVSIHGRVWGDRLIVEKILIR